MKASISVSIGLVMSLACSASAGEAGRGLVFGIGLGPAQTSFSDAANLSFAVGPAVGMDGYCSYGYCTFSERRLGRVVPRNSVPADAARVVPLPAREKGMGVSFVFGWAFSPKLAALADGDLAGGLGAESFDNELVGFVLRYSPRPRLWVEAGPAFGELAYHYDSQSFDNGSVDRAGRTEGEGALVAAGVELVRKEKWRLDLQARVGAMWYEHHRATNFSLQLGVSRRRS